MKILRLFKEHRDLEENFKDVVAMYDQLHSQTTALLYTLAVSGSLTLQDVKHIMNIFESSDSEKYIRNIMNNIKDTMAEVSNNLPAEDGDLKNDSTKR
jgi:hypothetical protein